MNDRSIFETFARHLSEKQRLEGELRTVHRRLAELEPRVLEQLTLLGLDRVTAGGRTLYPKRRIAAKVSGDRQAAAEALRAAGLNDLLKTDFNLNTLSNFFAEQLGERDPGGFLAQQFPGLAEHLELIELWKVGHLRAH